MSFAYSFDLAGACGSRYTCLINVGRRGSMVQGSAEELVPGTLWRLRVGVVAEGEVEMVLRDDACNPT